MFTRRDFLRTSSLLALAPAVPGFLARTARAAEPKRDARALVGRANYASALIEGERVGRPSPMDALALARRHGEADPVAFYTRLLLGAEPSPAWRDRLAAALGPKATDEGMAARRVAALVLALPESQLA